MFLIEYRRMSWWYWLVTVLFLTAGVAGFPGAFSYAIGLTVIQLVHFTILEKSLTAFPVQVRAGYLLLLLVAWPQGMNWLYWVPMIGTWAQLIFGYCAMARMVSLLPWNRTEPFGWALLKKTFFSRPVKGNILQGQPPLNQSPT